jgi:ComF family protein
MGHFARAVALLLDLLAPPTCTACEAPSTRQAFCPVCGPPVSLSGALHIDGVPLVVLGAYAPPLSTAIVRMKYQNRPELSRPLARLLVEKLEGARVPRNAPLVPVPLHARRLATRGYNQAGLLAQELARLSQRSCHPRLLQRVRETERQVGKSRNERRENSDGAFELRAPTPRQVVLVDDVVTTGSTVRACVQALARGGAELAAVVALAHAEQR